MTPISVATNGFIPGTPLSIASSGFYGEFAYEPWGGPGRDEWYKFRQKPPEPRPLELVTELIKVEVKPPAPVVETVDYYAREIKALEEALESLRIQIAAIYEQIALISERERLEALRLAELFEREQLKIKEFEAQLQAEREYLLRMKQLRRDEEDLLFIITMT